ncbi:lonely Cys domain-containing protein [Streptomyces sp. AM 2-1-1]|uniref:lonely Cys domain-containing protein n=1 Tax=Streptomyces sp. AM 2-1-1 TaxID=3028709 RepID=UPI0023B99CF3|nr:lonely Cys domain-containing protein [Streptomyces sp. AM 2-1-1]WEH43419.1 lonely Cys domain-containing protein [Streptomyces sp. AM 2-1-1]
MKALVFNEEQRTMLLILIGEVPLTANEEDAWNSRLPYRDLAKRNRSLATEIETVVNRLAYSLPGDVGKQFAGALKTLVDDGGVNHLGKFSDALDAVSERQVDNALEIQEGKREIIAELVSLMIEIALLMALAYFTGGTSLTQIALAKARSGLAILLVLQRLMHSGLPLFGAALEALQEAFMSFWVRVSMLANRPGERPDGFDWGKIGRDAVFGAFAGLLGGVGEMLGHTFKNNFKKLFDNKWLGEFLDLSGSFVNEGFAESVGETLTNGIYDKTWQWKPDTFWHAGVSGASNDLLFHGAGSGSLWLRDLTFTGPDPNVGLHSGAGGGARAGTAGPGPSTTHGPGPGAEPGADPPPLPYVPPPLVGHAPPVASTYEPPPVVAPVPTPTTAPFPAVPLPSAPAPLPTPAPAPVLTTPPDPAHPRVPAPLVPAPAPPVPAPPLPGATASPTTAFTTPPPAPTPPTPSSPDPLPLATRTVQPAPAATTEPSAATTQPPGASTEPTGVASGPSGVSSVSSDLPGGTTEASSAPMVPPANTAAPGRPVPTTSGPAASQSGAPTPPGPTKAAVTNPAGATDDAADARPSRQEDSAASPEAGTADSPAADDEGADTPANGPGVETETPRAEDPENPANPDLPYLRPPVSSSAPPNGPDFLAGASHGTDAEDVEMEEGGDDDFRSDTASDAGSVDSVDLISLEDSDDSRSLSPEADEESAYGTDDEADPLPAHHPVDPLAHQPLLESVFGPRIAENRIHPRLAEAVSTLDHLRLADAALGPMPLDVNTLAARVLHLDPGAPVGSAAHGELFRTVIGALDDGRAQSLDSLAAYAMEVGGALSVSRALPPVNGVPAGRDWSNSPPPSVHPHAVAVKHAPMPAHIVQPADVTGAAPWRGSRPYYVVASADAGGIVVRGNSGRSYRASAAEFVELLAHDPALTGLAPGTPIVLVVPFAGAGGLDLPRSLARRTGRTVWSSSGRAVLLPDPAGGPALVATYDSHPGVMPVGAWIPSRPDDLDTAPDPTRAPARIRTVDGSWVRDADVLTHTVVDESNRPAGRASMTHADWSRHFGYVPLGREAGHRAVPGITHFHHWNDAQQRAARSQAPLSGPEPLPWTGRFGGATPYFWGGHGSSSVFELALRDGRRVGVDGTEFGGYLRRRPSVSRLDRRAPIVALNCITANVPAGGDPLESLAPAQLLANETDRTVFSPTGEFGITPPIGSLPTLVTLLTDGEGNREAWGEFRPEPIGDALDTVARTAGFHTAAGPAPRHVRERALRLVRALRLSAGPDADEDPTLVRAAASLDLLRDDGTFPDGASMTALDVLDAVVPGGSPGRIAGYLAADRQARVRALLFGVAEQPGDRPVPVVTTGTDSPLPGTSQPGRTFPATESSGRPPYPGTEQPEPGSQVLEAGEAEVFPHLPPATSAMAAPEAPDPVVSASRVPAPVVPVTWAPHTAAPGEALFPTTPSTPLEPIPEEPMPHEGIVGTHTPEAAGGGTTPETTGSAVNAPPPAPSDRIRPRRAPDVGHIRVEAHLDRRRPPRIDPQLPPPPSVFAGTRFTDGTALPPPPGPAEVIAPDVIGGGSGQHRPQLRAPDDVVAEILRRLDAQASTRPAPGAADAPEGTGPASDIARALRSTPGDFSGDGLSFSYRTSRTRTGWKVWRRSAADDAAQRIVHVRARPYGAWERFADGAGGPTKFDSMHRTTVTTGQVHQQSQSIKIGSLSSVGPTSLMGAKGFGRLQLRAGWSRTAKYGTYDQTVNQTETRTLDSSHLYLDDVYYEVTVTAPHDGTAPPTSFGFGVRDGVVVRLPESAVKNAGPNRMPERIPLDAASDQRLFHTESYGPVAHLRDAAARHVGAKPGDTAYQELTSFFSTRGFNERAGMLAAGRVVTPVLFDAENEPLGVFSVRATPRRALLLGETDKAELRDMVQSGLRNDVTHTKKHSEQVLVAAGPAFNSTVLAGGLFRVRLMAGLNSRFGRSRGRSRTTGGTGAFRAGGQVKGDRTGLYWVERSVSLRLSGDPEGLVPEQTVWSLERMTRTEARRLAGFDDGTARLTEPFAPAYLTRDAPPTLGMSRVESFAHPAGAHTRHIGSAGRKTFLDHVTDEVIASLAKAYPNAVAPLDELGPRRAGVRSSRHYRIMLENTLGVVNVLSRHSMASNLHTLTTTGIPVRLTDPSRFRRGHRYVMLRGSLTNRRYEGTQNDLKIRFSPPGSQRLDGAQSDTREWQGGIEGVLAGRSTKVDDTSAPQHVLALSAGARGGLASTVESAHGLGATHEPLAFSTKPSHLFRYDLSVTATGGGYWRFRSWLRGMPSFGLLGLPAFVFHEGATTLIPPGSLQGEVLLSVPGEHAPKTDPHAPGAVNPYLPTAPPVVFAAMEPERAEELLASDTSVPTTGPGDQDLRIHPHMVFNTVTPPGMGTAVAEAVGEASHGSWALTNQAAPQLTTVTATLRPSWGTADLDNTSAPGGAPLDGLWVDRLGVLGTYVQLTHKTAYTRLTPLTGAVPVQTETTVGGSIVVSGRMTSTVSLSVGGQLTTLQAHTPDPAKEGFNGAYGVVANPYAKSKAVSVEVVRSVVAEINRKDQGHHVVVAADITHYFLTAAGSPAAPRRVRGREGTVPGGVLMHLPEKTAHRLKVLDDGLGDVPMYAESPWTSQPWMDDDPFGGFPVNSLDTAEVLGRFARALHGSGMDTTSAQSIRALVSARIGRALGKEMIGAGTSVLIRSGRYGWGTVNIGGRSLRVRARLIAVGSEFHGLGHSVEFEENRHAAEGEQHAERRASGPDFGTMVAETAHTQDPVAKRAGLTYTEVASVRRIVTSQRSDGTVGIHTATTTEPYAEYSTRYRLRITLDVVEGGADEEESAWEAFRGKRRVSEEGDAGVLREHIPLSLMRPTAPGTGQESDVLEPPAITAGSTSRPLGRMTPAALEEWRATPLPDGTSGPFTLPESGFLVRRIAGLENIRGAGTLALGDAYRRRTPGPPSKALLEAGNTGLTRAGTPAAQALERGTANAMLSTFYGDTLGPKGYRPHGLTERNFLGAADGTLALHSKPDFGRARLLTVSYGMKTEESRRTTHGSGSGVENDTSHDVSLGAGPVVSSPSTGTNPHTAALTPVDTGTAGGPSDAANTVSSLNVKPDPGRTFLFAIPTTWLSVGEVRRHLTDAAPVRNVRGPLGLRLDPGPQAIETEATVMAWIREDVARDLGLIDATSFPQDVASSWDAADAAAKAWVAADNAYWKVRRPELDLRARRDTAEEEFTSLREELPAALRAEETAHEPLATAERALRTAEEADADARTEAERVKKRVDTLEGAGRRPVPTDPGSGQDEADRKLLSARLLAELTARVAAGRVRALADARTLRRETEAATREAREAATLHREEVERRLPLARKRAEAVRDTWRDVTERLAALKKAADTAAAEHHRVRRAADRITRWYQLNATEEGRAQLGALEAPAAATFAPAPKKPTGQKSTARFSTPANTPGATRLTAPRGETAPPPSFVLQPPSANGDGFFRSLAEGLGHHGPELLGAHSLDPAAPSFTSDLLELLAGRLRTEVAGDPSLQAFFAPDETDTFTQEDLDAAGIDLPPHSPERIEFEATGRLSPYREFLPAQLAELAARQLLRSAGLTGESRWNHAASDVLPLLAARTFHVAVTVVTGRGGFQEFRPHPDTGAAVPQVVMYLDGGRYRYARPSGDAPATTLPAPAPETTAPVPPADGPAPRPAHTAPPWYPSTSGAPVFDASGDHRLLVGPDEDATVYDLVAPTADGNRFFAAVVEALRGPDTPADPARAVGGPGEGAGGVELRALSGAGRLRGQVSSAPLPDTARLDPGAVFRPDEIRAAGIDLDEDGERALRLRGGVLPADLAVSLTPDERMALIRSQLRSATAWNRETADLAAELAARAGNLTLTLVREDGTYRTFRGAPSATATPVVLYERGGEYLAARPRTPAAVPPDPSPNSALPPVLPVRPDPLDPPVLPDPLDPPVPASAVPLPVPATERPEKPADTKPRKKPGEREPEQLGKMPAPTEGQRAESLRVGERSFAVRPVRGDGDCLFASVLTGAALDTSAARLRADTTRWLQEESGDSTRAEIDLGGTPLEWLLQDRFRSAERLRELLGLSGARRRTELSELLASGRRAAPRGETPERRVRRERLEDEATLREEVLRRLRVPEGAPGHAEADRLWSRVLAVAAPAVQKMGPLRSRISADRTPLSDLVVLALRNTDLWHTPFFDQAPHILALALGRPLRVVTRHAEGAVHVDELNPSAPGAPLYVLHNGTDHYDALVPDDTAPGSAVSDSAVSGATADPTAPVPAPEVNFLRTADPSGFAASLASLAARSGRPELSNPAPGGTTTPDGPVRGFARWAADHLLAGDVPDAEFGPAQVTLLELRALKMDLTEGQLAEITLSGELPTTSLNLDRSQRLRLLLLRLSDPLDPADPAHLVALRALLAVAARELRTRMCLILPDGEEFRFEPPAARGSTGSD